MALVGFMAAGKSTIGRCLAHELGVPFTDTDDLIVARHGPVAALFSRGGEAAFRAAECEAVREALARPPGILALGGGALTYKPTRAALAGRALRVYLDLPAEALVARLRRSRTIRPVVGPAPTLERVRELLAVREPFYREADIIVTGPRRTKVMFVREIAARIADHQGTPRTSQPSEAEPAQTMDTT